MSGPRRRKTTPRSGRTPSVRTPGTWARGKKPIAITVEQFERLCELHITRDEAAAFFRCDVRTIDRYLQMPEYREAWERGQANGKLSLRRQQWETAQLPNGRGVQMLLHLSKHILGETDRTHITGLPTFPRQVIAVRRVFVDPDLDRFREHREEARLIEQRQSCALRLNKPFSG
jgi:hypothetical protein